MIVVDAGTKFNFSLLSEFFILFIRVKAEQSEPYHFNARIRNRKIMTVRNTS
jgi:hypothetical protein